MLPRIFVSVPFVLKHIAFPCWWNELWTCSVLAFLMHTPKKSPQRPQGAPPAFPYCPSPQRFTPIKNNIKRRWIQHCNTPGNECLEAPAGARGGVLRVGVATAIIAAEAGGDRTVWEQLLESDAIRKAQYRGYQRMFACMPCMLALNSCSSPPCLKKFVGHLPKLPVCVCLISMQQGKIHLCCSIGMLGANGSRNLHAGHTVRLKGA